MTFVLLQIILYSRGWRVLVLAKCLLLKYIPLDFHIF
nr:MAG TPA: hypothetical protein [Bacteriophage sp.]DAX15230.1 MAG TPA: hypothetical protein [Bacteriophage sp.]